MNNLPKVVTQLLPRVGFEPTTYVQSVQRLQVQRSRSLGERRVAESKPCFLKSENFILTSLRVIKISNFAGRFYFVPLSECKLVQQTSVAAVGRHHNDHTAC